MLKHLLENRVNSVKYLLMFKVGGVNLTQFKFLRIFWLWQEAATQNIPMCELNNDILAVTLSVCGVIWRTMFYYVDDRDQNCYYIFIMHSLICKSVSYNGNIIGRILKPKGRFRNV